MVYLFLCVFYVTCLQRVTDSHSDQWIVTRLGVEPFNFLLFVSVFQGCMPCHPQCETCNGVGLSFCTSCKYLRQDDKCVSECGKNYFIPNTTNPTTCHPCHPLCDQCRGPTESQCVKCKNFAIYEDLGIGENDEETGYNKSLAVSDT